MQAPRTQQGPNYRDFPCILCRHVKSHLKATHGHRQLLNAHVSQETWHLDTLTPERYCEPCSLKRDVSDVCVCVCVGGGGLNV